MFNRFIGKRSSRKPAAKTDDPGTVASSGNGSSASSAGTVVRGSSPANAPKGGSGASQTVAQGSSSPPPNAVAAAKPNGISTSFPLENLPAFRDVPVSDRQALFLMKLNLCCTVFDFADVNKNAKEKETKRQTLLELVDYVSSTSTGVPKFTEAVTEEIFRMISMNLFRALPPPPHESTAPDFFEPDEEEPAMDPAWPHLHMVYEFLLRYVASPEADPKTTKKFIDHSFVSNLLELFDSEDQRERDYLKTILHRIYGKFMIHRPFIRKVINNIFYRFVYETEKHNGIAELLEVLGSIINGFAMPLKEEHKLFLVRGLIPLHKPKCVAAYHQQLSYCITQFVEKDFKLADSVIRGLLKFWPVTNSHKELLFLGELEVVLETTQPAEFERCMHPLFRQIGRCMNSPHFQVAERALFLWNNDHIVALVLHNRQVILPLIFSALEKNTRNHWNKAVYDLTLNVRKMFIDMDQELFQACQEKFVEEEAKAESMEQRRVTNWKCLETLATKKGPKQ